MGFSMRIVRKALVGLHRLSELAIAAFPDDEMRWDCE